MGLVKIEITDTFGGEANYSWVRRYSLPLVTGESETALIRRVKREIGWTGVKCVKESWFDLISLKPRGVHQICFITFEEVES